MVDAAHKTRELGSEGWAEAAPLPFTHLFSVRCNDCGRRFFGWPRMGWQATRVQRYKRHWLTEHRDGK